MAITKEMILEAAKQFDKMYTSDGIKYSIELTHISDIKAGDTVVHNDKLMTVSKKDIKHDSFMGTSLFGDSYKSGRQLVKKAVVFKASTKDN